jgi:misacylated tRNA(Ala) deacylase
VATEDLYARDAYLTVAEARVVDVTDDGLVLDRTVCYPRGGGQPGDTGAIRWEGGAVRVADTVHRGADALHVLEAGHVPPPVGTAVAVEIDWSRRHRVMRTHTALHALSGIVFTDHGARVTGGNMEPGVARMDFELDAISQEFGRDVEQRLNAALARDRPVRVLFLPRAEALQDPDLIRTKVSLIPEQVDPVRVIDIEAIDRQADGGTHVRSTGEVGAVRVVKTESKGRGFKRMRIELVD